MISSLQRRGQQWAMAAQISGSTVWAKLPGTVAFAAAHHTLMIHLWTRKADRFVATAIALQSGRKVDAQILRATQVCADLVLALDHVTASWDAATAARNIRATMPAFAPLVGREQSKHYPGRLRELQELQELAGHLVTWVLDGGPRTSIEA